MSRARRKMSLDKNDEERFWEKVRKRDKYECWEWLVSTTDAGYGQFWLAPTMELSHRVSYWLEYNKLPEMLDHKCRNRSCVNPHHLRPATPKENNNNRRNVLSNFCAQSHLLLGDNRGEGTAGRYCKECARIRIMEKRRAEGMPSHEENKRKSRARTHCKNGHEFTEENTRYAPEGYRVCRQCVRDSGRRYRRREGAEPLGQKSHCKHRHEYTEENTRRNSRGHRECRKCLKARQERQNN